ncbi:unnamed protein product [Macrosiphum euphorbiae]|uniref:Uncharacterized protein n=1 Tax=Macrosiphum euphorbiae TaxID=13131 RepID=A0AAV0W7M0_9HEMI|nr:unnamed protein product [Macrosiphum euphorbiae]
MGMHNNTCGGGVVNGSVGVSGSGDMMSYATHTPTTADDYYGGASGLVADYDLPQCLGGRPPLEPAYAAECGVYYEKNSSAADYRSYYGGGGGDGAYDQLAVDVGGGSYHAHHQHHHHHHQHHHQHGHHNHQHPLQSAEAAVIITSSDGLSYTNLDCNGIASAVHGQDYGAYSDDGAGGGGYNGYGGHHRDDNAVRNESYCGGGGASVDNAFFNMHLNHNNEHSAAGRQAVQQPRPPSAQPPPPPVQSSAQTTVTVAASPLQLQPTPTPGDDRCPRVIKQEASSGGQCYGGRDGTSPYSDDASAYRTSMIAGQPQQHVQQQQQHHHHLHHQQQQQQQQHHQHHHHQPQQQQHCSRSNSGAQQKHGAATVPASSAVQTAVPTYKWMQVKRNVPKPAGKCLLFKN